MHSVQSVLSGTRKEWDPEKIIRSSQWDHGSETLPQGISLLPGIGIFGFGIFVALKWHEFQVGTGGAWNGGHG